MTICLYGQDPEDQDQERETVDHRLSSALALIAREADTSGAHGFAILWKDFHPISQCSFNISICHIDPFSIYCKMRSVVALLPAKSIFCTALDEALSQSAPSGHPGSMFSVSSNAIQLLSEIGNPNIESLGNWEQTRTDLFSRSIPLMCESWGLIGDFARQCFLSPAVRTHKSPWLKSGNHDWRSPAFAIPLLNSLLGQPGFVDGKVRCSDAMAFGAALSLDSQLRTWIRESPEPESCHQLVCCQAWNFINLSALIEEVALLTAAAKNVRAPKAPFKFFDAAHSTDTEQFVHWFQEEFLLNSKTHKQFFNFGLLAGPLLIEDFRRVLTEVDFRAHEEIIRPALMEMFLVFLRTSNGECDLLIDVTQNQKAILAALSTDLEVTECIDSVVEASKTVTLLDQLPHLMQIVDMTISSVPHLRYPTAPCSPDWDWLRQGVREMRERGIKYPALKMNASGQITTDSLDSELLSVMGDVADPDLEVLFCDESGPCPMVLKTTWAAIISGKYFAVK